MLSDDPRVAAIPDVHGHAKGEHKAFAEERPIPYSARMLFLWFFHACRRGFPRFMMVADHINYLTFEDPTAVNMVRRALKLAQAGDIYGAAETADVDPGHAAVVSEGLRKGMRFSIGAEVDNDPRSRPDAQNIVDAMRPDGLVRSVHFLPIDHPVHGAAWPWPFDNPEFIEFFDQVGVEKTWELYMAAILEAIEKLPGDIVGHFYAPAKFGHWPALEVLERYEDQLLDACAQRGMAVELNTRFLYRFAGDEAERNRYRDANIRLMRKAKAKDVGIAVGSDAHSPKDQGNAFEEVLAMLDEADVNDLVFPVNSRLARVTLRAVPEPEPEPEPLPPAAEPEAAAPAPVPVPAKRPAKVKASAAAAEAEPEEAQAAATVAEPPAAPPKRSSKATAAKAPDADEAPKAETAPAAVAKALEKAVRSVKAVAAKAKETLAKAAPGNVNAAKTPAAPKAASGSAVRSKAVPAPVAPKAAPAKASPVKTAPAKATTAKAAASKTTSARPAAKAAPARGASLKATTAKAATAKSTASKATGKAKAAGKSPAAKKTAGSKLLVKMRGATTSKAKTAAKPAAKRKPAAGKATSSARPASRGAATKTKSKSAKRPAPARKPASVKRATVKSTPAKKSTAKKAPAKRKSTKSRR